MLLKCLAFLSPKSRAVIVPIKTTFPPLQGTLYLIFSDFTWASIHFKTGASKMWPMGWIWPMEPHHLTPAAGSMWDQSGTSLNVSCTAHSPCFSQSGTWHPLQPVQGGHCVQCTSAPGEGAPTVLSQTNQSRLCVQHVGRGGGTLFVQKGPWVWCGLWEQAYIIHLAHETSPGPFIWPTGADTMGQYKDIKFILTDLFGVLDVVSVGSTEKQG